MKFIGLTNFSDKRVIYINVAHIIAIREVKLTYDRVLTRIYTVHDGTKCSHWTVEESVSEIIDRLNEVIT